MSRRPIAIGDEEIFAVACEDLAPDRIVPSPLDPRVAPAVAPAVAAAAGA